MAESLSASLYAAEEEAIHFLHHVWIHNLFSSYHPDVKGFSRREEDIQPELDPEDLHGGTDWEVETLRKNFDSLPKDEREARSKHRSRIVHFTILALETSNLKTPESYQLTLSVHLTSHNGERWLTRTVYDIALINTMTGALVELPRDSRPAVVDCMNNRYYAMNEKQSRYENAIHFYA